MLRFINPEIFPSDRLILFTPSKSGYSQEHAKDVTITVDDVEAEIGDEGNLVIVIDREYGECTIESIPEYVLVIEGGVSQGQKDNPLLSLSPEEHVAHYENTGMKRMDAIKAAAKDRGMSKSDFYKLVI
jgi:hypothetical protein